MPRKLVRNRLSEDLLEVSPLLRYLLGLLEAMNSFYKKKKKEDERQEGDRDHGTRAKLAGHKRDLCL